MRDDLDLDAAERGRGKHLLFDVVPTRHAPMAVPGYIRFRERARAGDENGPMLQVELPAIAIPNRLDSLDRSGHFLALMPHQVNVGIPIDRQLIEPIERGAGASSVSSPVMKPQGNLPGMTSAMPEQKPHVGASAEMLRAKHLAKLHVGRMACGVLVEVVALEKPEPAVTRALQCPLVQFLGKRRRREFYDVIRRVIKRRRSKALPIRRRGEVHIIPHADEPGFPIHAPLDVILEGVQGRRGALARVLNVAYGENEDFLTAPNLDLSGDKFHIDRLSWRVGLMIALIAILSIAVSLVCFIHDDTASSATVTAYIMAAGLAAAMWVPICYALFR